MLKKGLILFLCAFGFCEEQERIDYPSRLDIGGFYHNKDHFFGEIDLLLPFIQSDDFLFFGNLRGLDFEKSKMEMNLGLGVRVIFQDWLFGIYSFYDRKKSEYKNFFNQITAGIEAKTKRFTFDANGYLPFGKTRKLETDFHQTQLRDGVAPFQNIWFIDGKEVALWGFDGEFGYEILNGISLFAGWFYFNRHNISSTITGPQGRIEITIDTHRNNRFSVFDRIHLEAGITYDRTRKSRVYAGMRLSWDLGEKGKNRPKGLHKRMTEYVRRDFNIVTGVNDEGFQRLNNPDGSPVTVIIATNRTELNTAIFNNPNVVALDGIAGVGGESTLKDNQFFTGGIFPFGNGQEIILSDGGTIKNGIILGKNNTIRDLTFENAQLTNNLISKPHVGTLLVENVHFGNAGGIIPIEMTIEASGTNSNITIQNNTFNTQSKYAIFIQRLKSGVLTINSIENNAVNFTPTADGSSVIWIANGITATAGTQTISLGKIANNTLTINDAAFLSPQGMVFSNSMDVTSAASQEILGGNVTNNTITSDNKSNLTGILVFNGGSAVATASLGQKININQIDSNLITIDGITSNNSLHLLNAEDSGSVLTLTQEIIVGKILQNNFTNGTATVGANVGIFMEIESSAALTQSIKTGFNGGFFGNQIQVNGLGNDIELINSNATGGTIDIKVGFFGQGLSSANDGANVVQSGSGITITP